MRVAAYMRADLTRSDKNIAGGPFLVTLNPHTPSLGHNYAMPLPGSQPSADEIDALVALFNSRERTPRLEFVSSAAPEAEAELLAAGFAVDRRLPTLVMPDLDRLVRVPAPDGIVIDAVTADHDLLDAVAVQNEAYGEPSTSQAYELERMRAFVARGGVVVLGRDAHTGLASAPVSPRHRWRPPPRSPLWPRMRLTDAVASRPQSDRG